ncbi:hypothetical protein [Ferruginivarius sediminum]|uniref:Uncharacterized protein n=1 Tax=Ferruginivarius sediminum TaxID=2661937 RepID=A0A369T9A9_9PROT|nr:hypothetical protein [Ferruginivarius sediminum]RDD61868.1 hypothetical protein DRB17_10260 [Ferruginivarius sediminum]
MPAERSARLQIAKTYPYDAPAASYLFRDGGVHPIADADFRGRAAVIGHGSNRAPQQLARKFSHLSGRDSEIPVTYVWLHDYDVVYSAHVTAYGAVASTLQATPGCRVRVALTWLDQVQLQRMHETEGNYSYGSLAGARLEAEAGPDVRGGEVTMYLSDHGCLSDGGTPVALAAVPAEGRPHRALWQTEMHAEIHRRTASDLHLDDFILAAVENPAARRTRIGQLRADAIAANVPHFQPL